MTSKEMKERLSKRPNPHNLYAFNEEQVKELIKDLEILEELKEPYDEYENENYLCTRQAYYNNYLGELNYGYAIYKWDGTYKSRTSKLEIKDKNWVEIFHAGTSTEKRELNEEYLNGILKLLESLKKTMEEKKCDIN